MHSPATHFESRLARARVTSEVFVRSFALIALFSIIAHGSALAETVTVAVGPGGAHRFEPDTISIHPGDTVMWVWGSSGHSVTSGNTQGEFGVPDGRFQTPVKNGGSFSYTFPNPGTVDYYCGPHYSMGMIGQVIVANPSVAAQPLNLSTRLRVQTGENVMIGGFIITGTAPKKVIIRAIGPSLINAGIQDFLADPTLELHDASSTLVTNDNWKTKSNGASQESEVVATTVPPSHDLESAIVATLPANNANYTAIVGGKDATTGIGLVEVYDLNQEADSKLANISTRGVVQTGSNVMIGGFILGGGNANANLLVRAIGPSLSQSGLTGVLADPTLELRDGNGALLRSNDNWKTRSDGGSQQAEIEATGVPPQNELEAAILATLPPGNFTAIVAGTNNSSGVGLVEVYRLQ